MNKSAHTVRFQDVEERYAPAGKVLDLTVIGDVVLLELFKYAKKESIADLVKTDGITVDVDSLVSALKFFGVDLA